MKPVVAPLFAALVLTMISRCQADEVSYLSSLQGDWKGAGIVKVKTSLPEIAVDCEFKSKTSSSSLKLDGNCKALLVIMKAVSAELVAQDGLYRGTYIGARTGPAKLEGGRSGDQINLNITWAGDVNGDRTAIMRITKTHPDQMTLSIVDVDPATGDWITTSRFNLLRN